MRSGFPRSSMKIAACSSGGLAHFRFCVNFRRSEKRCNAAAPFDAADAATLGIAARRECKPARKPALYLRTAIDAGEAIDKNAEIGRASCRERGCQYV